MTDAGNWCLIESDPGVFTELIHKFGVTGLQVEELWSLDKEQFADLKPVFGWVSVSDYSKLRLSLAKHKTLKNEKYCEDTSKRVVGKLDQKVTDLVGND